MATYYDVFFSKSLKYSKSHVKKILAYFADSIIEINSNIFMITLYIYSIVSAYYINSILFTFVYETILMATSFVYASIFKSYNYIFITTTFADRLMGTYYSQQSDFMVLGIYVITSYVMYKYLLKTISGSYVKKSVNKLHPNQTILSNMDRGILSKHQLITIPIQSLELFVTIGLIGTLLSTLPAIETLSFCAGMYGAIKTFMCISYTSKVLVGCNY